ncbi:MULTISPECIES: HelD family protein [unclassified Clostridium]|uniref:HelD family protein n=1 Tax=unclassified Clostridium TaxID=2614128 RepID=UPI002911022A|nr:3'-5' exonuclease [Clostridium sp.]MDU5106457.1 3'-5' exonuclease [Clostridium sp.]
MINYNDDKEYLISLLKKLNNYFDELKMKVKKYENEFKESMKYLWENKSDMDGKEIFSNEKSISQIVTYGEAFEKQKNKIERMIDSPFFARIDFYDKEFNEEEEFYIGSGAFLDDDNNMLVYDWRAPIASMYYDFEIGDAYYDAPVGRVYGELILKRQFKIKDSNIEYAFDSSLSIGDDILQKELGTTSDKRMKTIIATIQKEQNKIIRDDSEVVIIQGVAGSGKTSIALHRVAFLLYKYKEFLVAKDIVIISPNKVFSDYISNVLPELGEEEILESSFGEIAQRYIGNEIEFEDYLEVLSELADEGRSGEVERIRFKSSIEFVYLLDDFIEYVNNNYFEANDYKINNKIISKEFIERRYEAYKKYSIFERVNKIANDIFEKIQVENMFEEKIPTKNSIIKTITKMVKIDSILNLYSDFYKHINREDMFIIKKDNKIEYSDVYPYIYLKMFVEGAKSEEAVKHVVIDEMQDYTPIQYAIINKLYKCNKTILGDFYQCVNPYNLNTLQDMSILFNSANIIELNKSYRSTYEIINFARKIQPCKIEALERHGDEPEIIKCNDMSDEIEKIKVEINKFKESNYSNLGIICKTEKLVEEIYKHLSEDFEVNVLNMNSSKFINGITITTVTMAKGLEFDEVIIPKVNKESYKWEYDRSLLYVACTRAMHKLIITYSGDLTEFL